MKEQLRTIQSKESTSFMTVFSNQVRGRTGWGSILNYPNFSFKSISLHLIFIPLFKRIYNNLFYNIIKIGTQFKKIKEVDDCYAKSHAVFYRRKRFKYLKLNSMDFFRFSLENTKKLKQYSFFNQRIYLNRGLSLPKDSSIQTPK